METREIRAECGCTVRSGADALTSIDGTVYRSFLNNHVLPKWADTRIQDIQPRPVELWLRELPLSPKSKTHVRSLMHGLWSLRCGPAYWTSAAIQSRWSGTSEQREGYAKRVASQRSSSSPAERATRAIRNDGPAVRLLGLRISEGLALRWADVDWLGSRLSVRRGIVSRLSPM